MALGPKVDVTPIFSGLLNFLDTEAMERLLVLKRRSGSPGKTELCGELNKALLCSSFGQIHSHDHHCLVYTA